MRTKRERKRSWTQWKRECRYKYTIKEVRILFAESLRIPGEGSSAQGKSGPKARPKGVVDGKQVEIPVPILFSDHAVTQKGTASAQLVRRSSA